ncbi:MAG: hypothetical protein JXB35_06280 [Anaerolineae bacterium]|nr:hypothetical protein [Anaerolineae bacterium]
MSLTDIRSGEVSPIQHHEALIATDLIWVQGQIESLGNPFMHLDKTNVDFLKVAEARITPWSFTGLPASKAPELLLNKANIQCVIFTSEETVSQLRKPLRQGQVMLYLPLMVIRGMAPLHSDAQASNFLDFWNAQFVPIFDAGIHFLAEAPVRLPQHVPQLNVRASLIQAYIPA